MAYRWLRLRLLGIATCFVASATTAMATDYHVDIDAPCGGDGLTWNSPFKYLQDALEVGLVSGDLIKVAQGTYYPDERSGNCDPPIDTGMRGESFIIPIVGTITLEGGYPGFDQPNRDQRDPALFDDTILSGDIDQDDGVPFANYDGNSFHVVRIWLDPNNPPPPAIENILIDGFRITAGNANFNDPTETVDVHFLGGGALIEGSLSGGADDPGPTFANCFFHANRADGAGGGLFARKIGARVVNCAFTTNETDSEGTDAGDNHLGGGAISVNGPLDVVECRFLNNQAHFFQGPVTDHGDGGAVGSSPNLAGKTRRG